MKKYETYDQSFIVEILKKNAVINNLNDGKIFEVSKKMQYVISIDLTWSLDKLLGQ